MFDQPFKLTKHFRYEEECDTIRRKIPWTKTILNMENGSVFGRTPIHWFYVVCFYTIFFSGIALLWLLCYLIFQITIKDEYPKWLLPQPGFSIIPAMSFADKFLEIKFDEKSETDIENIIDHIKVALSKYGQVPKEYFGVCQYVDDYGYRERKPCFFLKINRIIGFKAETIASITDLPLNTPKELRLYIKNMPPEERQHHIWLSCESEPWLDFDYYPQRYYLTSHVYTARVLSHNRSTVFPLNDDDQRFYDENDFKRIIAVQVVNISINVRYQVRCVVWAKNIRRDFNGKMGRGVVNFNLQIKS